MNERLNLVEMRKLVVVGVCPGLVVETRRAGRRNAGTLLAGLVHVTN